MIRLPTIAVKLIFVSDEFYEIRINMKAMFCLLKLLKPTLIFPLFVYFPVRAEFVFHYFRKLEPKNRIKITLNLCI